MICLGHQPVHQLCSRGVDDGDLRHMYLVGLLLGRTRLGTAVDQLEVRTVQEMQKLTCPSGEKTVKADDQLNVPNVHTLSRVQRPRPASSIHIPLSYDPDILY